ncbi:complement C1q 2 isoform X2 [Labeo rohita]|uniref:Complement C1q 2 isoform X2 n=1 Tax=Labeo rohita TaxID=84645 RepID=A0A498NP97_LABRO|nr:complement C1q 2 isoform X2 [Labeo rohita]
MEDEMERLKTENEGIFTAPVRGAYAFRVFSKAFGNPERAVTAGLFKNDQHIISTYGRQAGGFISSSNGVSLLLEEGDKVKVNLYPGIFTAPVRGAYAFRVFSKAFGNPERAVTAGLFKNDQHIISTYGRQAGGFISSSNGVSLLLEEGDKVKVNLYPVSKVAFSVSLSSSNGPHSRPRTLIYKHIFLNTGDAYNSNTGIFTAPMKGVYAFKVFSKTYGSQDDKASKVAFSASLLTSFGPKSVGPFHNGLHTLIYKHVFLNTGNAYNPNTGIFTAPVRGAYAFRVFSKASGNKQRAVTAGLFKNNQHIISTHAHQVGSFISSSNGVSLLLEEGDQVKVNLYPGQWIFDNGQHHHSTFCGHLLFPM